MGKKILGILFVSLLISCAGTGVLAVDTSLIEVKDLKGGVEKETSQVQTEDENQLLLKGKVENKTEFHVLNEIQLNINDVSGPGRESSSVTDGVNYLENLNIYGKGNLGELDYQFNVGARTTSDNRIDVRGMTVTTLQGKATYQDHTFSAGDVFESFSQYSLNTSLKGYSYKFADTEDNLPDVTLIYGYSFPRWESFFRAKDCKAMQRRAYGLNIREDLTSELTAGFSYVRSDDDQRQSSSDTLFNNNVYSLDFEYRPIQGLTLRGESAYSNGRKQLEEAGYRHSYFGHAQRLEATAQGGPSKVNMEYEFVSPKFESSLGSASQNRQKAKINWKYRYNKNVNFTSGFMWYCNSLDNARNRTHTYKPEVGVEVKRLFKRKYSVLAFNFKLDDRTGKTQSSFDHFTTLSYRDRFGLFDVDQDFGFTSYNTDKRRRESYEYNYHTSISSRHTLGDFVFKPSINAGTNFVDDDLLNRLDKIVEYSVGLGVDVPKHKITSNFKFGQNILNATTGSDNSNKLFTNISIYYKPSFLGYFNNSTIFLRAAINDFNFQTQTRNFCEKTLSMGLNIPVDLFVGKNKPEKI